MEIKFSCTNPACGQHIKADEAWAGRSLSCPACGTIFQVPSLSVPSPVYECHSPISRIPVRSTALTSDGEIASLLKTILRSRLWSLLQGWSIGAVLFAVLIGGLYLRVWVVLPRHFNQMANEIFAPNIIRDLSTPNHNDTALYYVQDVTNGVGIFHLNLDTLQSKQIGRVETGDNTTALLEARYWENTRYRSFRLFNWSPDDQYWVYSTTAATRRPNQHIVICDGATGAEKHSFNLPNSTEEAVWLTANSLALMDDTRKLYLYNIKADAAFGEFGKRGLVPLRQLNEKDNPYDLTVVSSNIVAYIETNNIWNLNIASNQPVQLTHLTNAILGSLTYNPATRNYYVSVAYKDVRLGIFSTCEFNPLETADDGLTLIADGHPVTNRATSGPIKGRWTQGVAGIVLNVGGVVGVTTMDGSVSANLFTEGHVQDFDVTANGDKIYALASQQDEPMQIWEYDIAQKNLHAIVAPTENLRFSQIIPPITNSFILKRFLILTLTNTTISPTSTNITETILNRPFHKDYYTLLPPDASPDKKYPVVINTVYESRGEPGGQLIANAGILYVSPLHTPYSISPPILAEDLLIMYREVLKNPQVDPSRIYLLCQDSNAKTVKGLVDDHPDFWRGVIYLSPVAVPKISPSGKKFPATCTIITNEKRQVSPADYEQFTQQACHRLIPVDTIDNVPAEPGRTKELFFLAGGAELADLGRTKEYYKTMVRFICAN
jgi:hypothetical protein